MDRSMIRTGLRNPPKAINYIFNRKIRKKLVLLNKLFHSRFGFREYNPAGIDTCDADWDNMIILDAARVDAFESWLKRNEEVNLNLQTKISRGSQTPEWLAANFQGSHNDIVYVTGNSVPYDIGVVSKEEQSNSWPQYEFELEVYDMVNVWEKEESSSINLQKKRSGATVVTPEQMFDAAIKAEEEYPNKRLLIHYTQPHDPYIGEYGQTLHSRYASPLSAYIKGADLSLEKIWSAYQENCDLALESAYSLAKKLEGKTVITSDHGELISDRLWPIPVKEVKHPNKLYVPELVQVPWIEISGERKKIIDSDSNLLKSEGLEDKLSSHLEALGYK